MLVLKEVAENDLLIYNFGAMWFLEMIIVSVKTSCNFLIISLRSKKKTLAHFEIRLQHT